MSRAYIALGSNLGDPPEQLRGALRRLNTLADVRLVAQSSLYRSVPLGPADQPDYCNAVCAVETTLSPQALLEGLQAIENACGRNRGGPHWGPRTLDLDLLLYDALIIDTPELKLPHPELLNRNFVLVPLAEIAADLELPGVVTAAVTVADWARRAGTRGLAPWTAA